MALLACIQSSENKIGKVVCFVSFFFFFFFFFFCNMFLLTFHSFLEDIDDVLSHGEKIMVALFGALYGFFFLSSFFLFLFLFF